MKISPIFSIFLEDYCFRDFYLGGNLSPMDRNKIVKLEVSHLGNLLRLFKPPRIHQYAIGWYTLQLPTKNLQTINLEFQIYRLLNRATITFTNFCGSIRSITITNMSSIQNSTTTNDYVTNSRFESSHVSDQVLSFVLE